MFIAGRKYSSSHDLKTILTKVYGIGRTRTNFYFNRLSLQKTSKIADSLVPLQYLGRHMDVTVSTAHYLRRLKRNILRSHLKYGSYRGIRMRQGLPRNGQRTHSNGRTARLRLDVKKLFKKKKK